MADNALTTVSYDVSAAISALEQLDSKVKQSGQTAEQAFDKGGQASQTFDTNLGGLSNTMGQGAGAAALYANQTLELAGNLSRAASVAAEFITIIAEQGFGYETAAEQVDEYIARLDKVGQIIQNTADIQNAAINAQQDRALFLSSRSQLATERVEVQKIATIQQSLNTQLAASRAHYSQLDAIADKSGRTRQQLEDKLGDLVASTNERRFLQSISKLTGNQQIAKLIEQANALKNQGGENNLQSAENLLNKAQQQASRDGNGFNQRRVEEAFNGLIQKRAEDTVAAEKQTAAQRAQADTEAKVTAGINNETKALKDKSIALQNTIQQSALTRQDQKQQQVDTQKQQQFDAAQKQFRKELLQLNQNATQQIPIIDRLPGLGSIKEIGITEQEFNQQKKIVEEAFALRERIDARIKADPTPRGVLATAGDREHLTSLISEGLQDIPNLSKQLSPDVTQLQKSLDLYLKIEATIKRTVESSRKLDGTGPDSVKSVRPAGVAVPNPNQGASNSTNTTNQNVSVDVQIKGGMIDADTAQQIAGIVQREIRKGTVDA